MYSSPLTKNRFTLLDTVNEIRSVDTAPEKIVFISYRREGADPEIARKCAEILEAIPGLYYWFDEDDDCMQETHAHNDDIQKAQCIERGLNISSALLGIIGRDTFNSPWIPYEIGGAHGRQHYKEKDSQQTPHPLIAHLIYGVSQSDVPGFVGLGTPLVYRKYSNHPLSEVKIWAQHLAEFLRGYSVDATLRQRVNEIYNKNTRNMKSTWML